MPEYLSEGETWAVKVGIPEEMKFAHSPDHTRLRRWVGFAWRTEYEKRSIVDFLNHVIAKIEEGPDGR